MIDSSLQDESTHEEPTPQPRPAPALLQLLHSPSTPGAAPPASTPQQTAAQAAPPQPKTHSKSTASRSPPPSSRSRWPKATAPSKSSSPRDLPTGTDYRRRPPPHRPLAQHPGPRRRRRPGRPRPSVAPPSSSPSILVNGLRVNDPETGHLNLDIPVPLDAITRIDILHGSGSTFYGSDAIGGAVNLLTGKPARRLQPHRPLRRRQLRLDREPSPRLLLRRPLCRATHRQPRHLRRLHPRPQLLLERPRQRVLAQDSSPAPPTFCSPPATAPTAPTLLRPITIVGAHQGLARQHPAATRLAHRRQLRLHAATPTSSSSFVDQPAIYENNHITTSYEGALRRADDIGRNTTLAYGLEEAGDTIHSNSLGLHARNQGAGYANLSLRSLGRFSLSIGAREEVLSSHGSVFSPSAAAAFTLTKTTPTARLRRPRLPPAHLRRPLLLRSVHHRQSHAQTRIQLELRRRRRLDARQRPSHAHRRRLPPQPDQRHRLLQARSRSPPAKSGRPSTFPRSTSPARKPPPASASPEPSSSNSATPPPTPATCRRTTSPSTPSTTPRRTPSSRTPDRFGQVHRSHPGQHRAEDHPDRLPALGHRPRAQRWPRPPLPPPAQPLQHRLPGNPPSPHARPHHHGRHGTQLVEALRVLPNKLFA